MKKTKLIILIRDHFYILPNASLGTLHTDEKWFANLKYTTRNFQLTLSSVGLSRIVTGSQITTPKLEFWVLQVRKKYRNSDEGSKKAVKLPEVSFGPILLFDIPVSCLR